MITTIHITNSNKTKQTNTNKNQTDSRPTSPPQGWGCAYRSLQTLLSWFQIQGYGDIEIPTIKVSMAISLHGSSSPFFSFPFFSSHFSLTLLSFLPSPFFFLPFITFSSFSLLSSRYHIRPFFRPLPFVLVLTLQQEIQKLLCSLDGKPPSFVGSREWIGSTEVSIILRHFYHIDCKFLHVQRGSDVSTLFNELSRHFSTVGTPVMVGGGVLAYTLLGVR